MSDVVAKAGAKASRREWIGLAVIAIPCLIYSMDLTVLYLAVPQIVADLKPSAAELLWIVDIYGFMVAGALVTMGTLGDRIGRRKVLLIGAAAFGITSVLAAYSTSAEMLIVARALQGLAAATLAPSTLSLIRNMFLDPQERAFAIGIWVASFSAGAVIGPVFGGMILAHFWWGAVFLINVPVMLMLLILGPVLLPEFRDPEAGHMDPLSAAQSVVAVLGVIYGIKRLAEDGWALLPIVSILVGLAVGVIFFRRERRLADPLIDVRLFSAPAFSAALATNVLGLFMVLGSFLFITQYLQLVLGMGPLEAGLWMAPSGVVFALGSMAAPILVRNFHPSSVIATGLLLSALGFASLTQIADCRVPVDAARRHAGILYRLVARSAPSPPISSWAPRRRNGPAPPRPSRRRASSSAARSASPCSVACSRLSMVAACVPPLSSRPCRQAPLKARVMASALQSRWRRRCPASRARNSCRRRARRLSTPLR